MSCAVRQFATGTQARAQLNPVAPDLHGLEVVHHLHRVPPCHFEQSVVCAVEVRAAHICNCDGIRVQAALQRGRTDHGCHDRARNTEARLRLRNRGAVLAELLRLEEPSLFCIELVLCGGPPPEHEKKAGTRRSSQSSRAATCVRMPSSSSDFMSRRPCTNTGSIAATPTMAARCERAWVLLRSGLARGSLSLLFVREPSSFVLGPTLTGPPRVPHSMPVSAAGRRRRSFIDASERSRGAGVHFVVEGNRPSRESGAPPASRAFPSTKPLGHGGPERKIALDIVLGHPAWHSPLTSADASPRSPEAAAHRTSESQAGAIKAYADLLAPAPATSAAMPPTDSEAGVTGGSQASDPARGQGAGGGQAEDGWSDESLCEEDRYDAIELLDTYSGDEDENRAVEAFELAAEAALENQGGNLSNGTLRASSPLASRRFAASRFETQEPALVQGVQGRNIRRPASSCGVRELSFAEFRKRPQSSAAGRRPASALEELRQIQSRRGLSPELQHILERARMERGVSKLSMERGGGQAHMAPVDTAHRTDPGRTNGSRSPASRKTPSFGNPPSIALRPASAGAGGADRASENSSTIEEVLEMRRRGTPSPASCTASRPSPAADVLRRRLSLISPSAQYFRPHLPSPQLPAGLEVEIRPSKVMLNGSWKRRGARAGILTRPSSGGSPLKSGLSGTMGKIRLREAELVVDQVSGSAVSGGVTKTGVGQQAGVQMTEAPQNTHATATFVSVDSSCVVDAAKESGVGIPLPPNHNVVERYDEKNQWQDIYVVPQSQSASKADAEAILAWMKLEWCKFLHRSGRSSPEISTHGREVGADHDRSQEGGMDERTLSGMSDEEYVRRGNSLLALGFQEVLRQVYVHCRQRGRALEYIWQLHLSLTDSAFAAAAAAETKYRSLREAFQKGYTCQEDIEQDIQRRAEEVASSRSTVPQKDREELVYRMVGMEKTIQQLSDKFERSKTMCRRLKEQSAARGPAAQRIAELERALAAMTHRAEAAEQRAAVLETQGKGPAGQVSRDRPPLV